MTESNSRYSDYIAHLDGYTNIPGGGLTGHWIQLCYQLADSLAGFAYSFGGSCIILFLINLVPGLGLRATEEAEVIGMDDAEIGEFAVSGSTHVPFTNQRLTIPSMTLSSSRGTLSTAETCSMTIPSTRLIETRQYPMRRHSRRQWVTIPIGRVEKLYFTGLTAEFLHSFRIACNTISISL